MQKLTDQEFNVCRAVCGDIRAEGPNFRRDVNAAMRKLLANYQEQLEAESYAHLCDVEAELRRPLELYTEANTCTTTLDLDIRDLCPRVGSSASKVMP